MDGVPAFTEDQWQNIHKRLTYYASGIFMRHGWWHNGKCVSPRGHKPEEFASEAIIKTIEGKRIYNAQKCPDILHFLKGVVKSDISHIIESPDFTRRENSQGEIEEKDQGRNADPLQICLEKEQIDVEKNVVRNVEEILEKHFSEDKIVISIYECYKAGIYKRSELADYLQVDAKEIDNAQKRIRSKMDKHLPKSILEDIQ